MTAGTTREHLGYALALAVPVFVAVTKVDAASNRQLERTMKSLQRTLSGPGCNKIPYRVTDEDQVYTAATNILSQRLGVGSGRNGIPQCTGLLNSMEIYYFYNI